MSSSYQDWARAFHGAAFLLPSLAPGQRVLDLGCGPGAITRGLAERVAPGGTVVGVDADPAHLDTARTLAPGVRFEQADAADLPFEDDAFDVAFLSALLQHVESPAAVLAEVRRVVRPGGVVGVSDADLDGYLLHPMSDGLGAALALDRRTRRHPDVGRRLPELLFGAGFAAVDFSAQPTVVQGADDAARTAGAAALRLEAAPFADHARAQGWLRDGDDLPTMAEAWREWATAPGAVFVTFWCQALAR